LRNAAAVRRRCDLVYRFVADGHSQHFTIAPGRIDAIADAVASMTRENYPDLHIPVHSRWRHFMAGGSDRWSRLVQRLDGATAREQARTAIDLVTISVLLDAGAGAAWRYREADTGCIFARSEGLAVASFDMFADGFFSSHPTQPWRTDAVRLQDLDEATLAHRFQVSSDTPLVGLKQRANLLNRLGSTLLTHPDLFGANPARPGNIVDYFVDAAHNGGIPASEILATLLDGLSSIWPSGLVVDGVALGDVGRHPAVTTRDRSDGLVPFHKLSQWLTYSLVEPIEAAGLQVVELDRLTGLAEYRNGGLFLDFGAIVPRAPLDANVPYPVSSELVVEWRALTIALTDRLLNPVREKLGVEPTDFPLAKMLQGGTWAAGRKIATQPRPPAGPPPLVVVADGTVF
jgi:hypothetical protein